MNNNVKGLMGALVTGVAGIATGYVAGAINNPKPPVYREPEPICGCSHHKSYHGSDGGECNYTETRRILVAHTDDVVETKNANDGGSKSKVIVPATQKWETTQAACGCKHYVGPEPVPQYI